MGLYCIEYRTEWEGIDRPKNTIPEDFRIGGDGSTMEIRHTKNENAVASYRTESWGRTGVSSENVDWLRNAGPSSARYLSLDISVAPSEARWGVMN